MAPTTKALAAIMMTAIQLLPPAVDVVDGFTP
jgi:hypothetical protein